MSLKDFFYDKKELKSDYSMVFLKKCYDTLERQRRKEGTFHESIDLF